MEETRLALEDEAGDVIQKARFGRALSISELAIRSGVAPDQLTAIERLERPPSEEEAVRLAEALGLRRDALLALLATPSIVPAKLPPGWRRLHRAEFRVNAYLYLGDVHLLIDAGVFAEDVRRYTDRLDAIFLTHEHHDHIDRLADLRRLGEPRVFGHEEFRHFLKGVEPLAEGEGAFGLTAIATPGHSELGLSYFGRGVVATGDAVYARSIGRADMPEHYPLALASLAKIMALPGETVLLPGHGPTSTVLAERSGQPFPYV